MSLGKVAIIGSGAVGSYYGARLVEHGHDVHFLLRSDYDHVRQHGLQISSIAGDLHLPHIQCSTSPAEIGPVDLVIVAWKATANHAAAETIAPLIGPHTAILTLQNGLGNCEHLADLFGADRIIGGLCFVCINRLSPGHISHTAAGLIRIGAYAQFPSDRLHHIATTFQSANFPCQAVSSLEKALWMKLVWNIPFNGLAIAEGGVDTEVLLHERALEPRIRRLMAEVIATAKALGHHIPDSFIDQQIEITYPMGPYRPSSMIDFVEGRPVEFNAIWEIPLQTAQSLNVPTPEIAALTSQIRDALQEQPHS